MKRKLVALAIAVSMIFCICTTGCANTQVAVKTIEVDGTNVTIVETLDKKAASTTVEGVELKCEHVFETDEYWLHIGDNSYQFNVTDYGDHIEISMVDEITVANYEDKVVGQGVLTLTFAVPAFITAAKILLTLIAGYAATTVVWVSLDAISNVITGVRNNSNTYWRYSVVSMSAANSIRFGRMNRYNTYYEAMLSGNTVMVGREISQWAAITRLQFGYDVFATSAFAASYACIRASTSNNIGKPPIPHNAQYDGHYPHYHPLGRHWVKNWRHAPHCWYPY